MYLKYYSSLSLFFFFQKWSKFNALFISSKTFTPTLTTYQDSFPYANNFKLQTFLWDNVFYISLIMIVYIRKYLTYWLVPYFYIPGITWGHVWCSWEWCTFLLNCSPWNSLSSLMMRMISNSEMGHSSSVGKERNGGKQWKLLVIF